MNYTINQEETQMQFALNESFFKIPNNCDTFVNTDTTIETTRSNREVLCLSGYIDDSYTRCLCPSCESKMHVNQQREIHLRHLPFGTTLSVVNFNHIQYVCTNCNKTSMYQIPFKSKYHSITIELEQYIISLLNEGTMTLKSIAHMTGVGKNTVKAIDIRRLRELYTVDGEQLIQPETNAKYIAIDEFKLHHGHQYATHIINLENGHIIWIAKGKKKQVVYDFIEHVGLEWMSNVVAIACDMNSDFQEAFMDKCPDIQIVFDPFHIVKNYNDKVIGEIRKDEQRRLIEEGNHEAARMLKKTRYVLTSSLDTLKKKDEQAKDQYIIKKGSSLFKTGNVVRKGGHYDRYYNILKENELLSIVHVIREKLKYAYSLKCEIEMTKEIEAIIELCITSGNVHLLWFKRLLSNHFEGIIAHGTFNISSGKIEGINNKIKTLRRQGYGYPDDEYFFLKIIDASRNTYIRNPKSHKICD